VVALVMVTAAGCGGGTGAVAGVAAPPTASGSAVPSPSASPQGATAQQRSQQLAEERQVAAMDDITAAFENGKVTPQYAYIKDQHDGCGYTAGWIGFCTAYGDILDVVRAYTQAAPANVLRQYTGALDRLAATKSVDTAPLGKGFTADWRKAAADPVFRTVQLRVGHNNYLTPAKKLAAREGVTTPLGLENLFDSALMMGPSKSACDGMLKLAAETDKALGGNPAHGVKETDWIVRFDQIRIQHLRKPCTPGRQADWPRAVPRVQALQALATAGNWRLDPPIRLGGSVNLVITDPVH
jgi:chitosanase